jgi:WD40 repeat protein
MIRRVLTMDPQQAPLTRTWFGSRQDFEYDIFISYRRGDGLQIAEWLSRRLRAYRPPRGFPRPLSPLRVYRDVERERVTPAIWEERIRPALVSSRFMIVVLTDSVAAAPLGGTVNWVVREVSGFLETPQRSNVMIVRADPRVPLPPEISAHFPDPGWLDVRPSHLRWWRRIIARGTLQDKISALVVPALDIADAEIPRLTQLAEREKRRVAWAITAVSVVLALVVTTLAALAWVQAIAAREAATVRTAESIIESNPTAAALLLLLLPERDPPEGTIAAATQLARTPLSTVLWGHQLWVSSGAFTPDGRKAVTASGDGTVRVWSADGVGIPVVLSGRDVSASLGSVERALGGVTVHPNGRSVLAIAGSRVAQLWHIDGGSPEPQVLPGHAGWIRHAIFSGDGTRLLTSASDETTRIWNADGLGTPVDVPIEGTAFSPDAALIVGRRGRTIEVWRSDGTSTPYSLALGDGDGLSSSDATFSPDGRAIVIAAGMRAYVWRFEESSAPTILQGHDKSVTSAVFSPDGTLVLTASDDGTARLWDVVGPRPPVVLRGHAGRVFSAVFSGDGTRVLTASEDATARVWRANASEAPLILRGHEGYVMNAAFSSDGARVITTGADRTARIWDVSAPGYHLFAAFPQNSLRSASVDPAGQLLATAHTDGTARLLSTDGKGDARELRGHKGRVNTVAFSRDGQRLLTAGNDTTARIWRLDASGVPVVLKGHQDTVYSAAFSSDSTRVVTASDDRTAAIWSINGGAPQMILRGHRAAVRSAAFDRTDTQVITASEDGTARVWRIGTDQEPLVLGRHGTDVRAAAFSPDGQRAATADASGVLRLWRLDRATDPLLILRGHANEINTVAFSADGTHVVTSSNDGSARVWNSETGWEEVTLPHATAVLSAQFADDSRRILTASAGGEVRSWAIGWLELRTTLRGRTSACLTDEQRRRYLGETPEMALRAFDGCEISFGRRPVRLEHVASIGEEPEVANPK